ncbi:hypothetical protein V5O48_004755 [Marasmius crinis-equi]|uniref:Uncharacterized protein n=1 Tax=Marasmius crinis-equi TaxID=585013 RepID=A0ABR3FPG0_9AGAR
MDKKHKTAVALINFMAAASQGLSTFALWYSFRVHMDEVANLNIRRSPSPSEKRDIDLPMVSKLKRDDSILGSRRNTPGPALSPITPTSTGGDPFAHHGRPTPFMEQNPSDTRVSEKAAISRSYEQYPPLEGAEQLQAEPWTPQPDTMEFSNASYPTFTSTPTHSNQDLTGSVSGTGSSKGKGKEKYDEPDLELQSRTSKSIRKLPPVPGAVVVNH